MNIIIIADMIRSLKQGYPIEKTALFRNRDVIADYIDKLDEKIQAEQQAHNALKEKFDNLIDDINCEIGLLEVLKDNGIVNSAVMHLKIAINEDNR